MFSVRLPKSQTLDQLRQLILTLPKSLRRQFYWLLPLAVLPGVLDILSVGILAQLMSSLLMSKAKRQIIPIHIPGSDRFEFVLFLIGAFILISWLRSLARLWLVISQEQYIERMWLYLTDHLYRGILYLPYEFHLAQDDSKLATQLLTNVTKVTRGILRPCLPLFSSFFSVVLLTGGILYVGRWYALGLFAGLTLAYGLFSVFMTPYLRHAERQKLYLASQMKQTFIDSMTMIREIQLYAAEDFYADSFRDKAQEAKKFEFLNTLLPWFPKLTIEPLGITLIFSFAIFPAVLGGGFSDVKQVIPFLATLALASLRLTPALQETFASITKLRSGLPNISSLLKLMQIADEGSEIPTAVLGPGGTPMSPQAFIPRRTIRLDRITYAYPTTNHSTITDLSLTIPVGSRVAFVGSTGSGKTTTGLLLLALLTPQKGQLLIDGTPLDSQDRRAWQSCCSYVPQIVSFTRGSVLENIAFGEDPDQVDLNLVWESLESAQLAEVVAELPYGLYTPIGRDGLRLSGGQRQRLALARAFYRRTEVLLLDEATSALDNKTESEVIEALEIIGRRCTTIVIAHRLSTIVRCDRIYEFEAGRIKAAGNFEQLRAASSSFEELVATLERSLAAAS
ncbi:MULTISPECIES: ABC transporter ATP-binding protein [unclassified Synechococcus]|uniref:ABC transporter ATP-binding protein n=1 Tax=unclassified Synechococcus TaxID=2626047 RepID=UPI0018CD8CDF|nr:MULTISPECIES: ABC transporter ATP-binding protein [unclassified Synechococcus]MEA5424893.1 ABC transporter ATP-binding protein [Synechococcus sp. CCY9202]QPN60695.1 ABC transporter ATP-binding protein [Synechococcus sp. CBW1002]QPN67606.1 ABC transporter ATP-binding protein [Synechococcus sp. CBW1006]CAK6687481.1 Protein glycosylation K [Synechococcus sp. CBW1107]